MNDLIVHVIVWIQANYIYVDVHSLSSWRAVDTALEIHVELLKSCSRGFDEKSSKSETSSECTFSLLTIDESD